MPIVVDEEAGISQAIGNELICADRVVCWNHIINSAKIWLKKHGATTAEIPAYTSHIRELLNQSSEPCYEEKIKSFVEIWSQPFCRYYMENVHHKVLKEVMY